MENPHSQHPTHQAVRHLHVPTPPGLPRYYPRSESSAALLILTQIVPACHIPNTIEAHCHRVCGKRSSALQSYLRYRHSGRVRLMVTRKCSVLFWCLPLNLRLYDICIHVKQRLPENRAQNMEQCHQCMVGYVVPRFYRGAHILQEFNASSSQLTGSSVCPSRYTMVPYCLPLVIR